MRFSHIRNSSNHLIATIAFEPNTHGEVRYAVAAISPSEMHFTYELGKRIATHRLGQTLSWKPYRIDKKGVVTIKSPIVGVFSQQGFNKAGVMQVQQFKEGIASIRKLFGAPMPKKRRKKVSQ